jgi:SARP family transcriptional regulator, regulator of embCAB operon
VSREQLTSVLWPDNPPREAEAALNVVLSKLRATLKKVGLGGEACVEVQSGTVQMRLPSKSWVDIEEAANSIDEANGALRAGDTSRAWSHANVVVTVARRPFLADEEAPWIEARRVNLRSLLVRGLHDLSRISAINREEALAVQYASQILDLEPFQETGYRHLMRLQAQMGNGAEARRVLPSVENCCARN